MNRYMLNRMCEAGEGAFCVGENPRTMRDAVEYLRGRMPRRVDTRVIHVFTDSASFKDYGWGMPWPRY